MNNNYVKQIVAPAKVYVVKEGMDYEGDWIVGVYRSREEAEEKVKTLDEKNAPLHHKIEEWEVT